MGIFFNKTKQDKVKMVHDSDLDELLDSLGLLRSVNEGEVKCCFCGNTVKLEDIEVIVPDGENIKIVCSNIACIDQLQNG